MPVRDARAIADAVTRLVGDPDERRRMGGAARRRAEEHFDQQTVIDRTLDSYRLLDARTGSGSVGR